jgi:hypothetical protein
MSILASLLNNGSNNIEDGGQHALLEPRPLLSSPDQHFSPIRSSSLRWDTSIKSLSTSVADA